MLFVLEQVNLCPLVRTLSMLATMRSPLAVLSTTKLVSMACGLRLRVYGCRVQGRLDESRPPTAKIKLLIGKLIWGGLEFRERTTA